MKQYFKNHTEPFFLEKHNSFKVKKIKQHEKQYQESI